LPVRPEDAQPQLVAQGGMQAEGEEGDEDMGLDAVNYYFCYRDKRSDKQ
jgi:hypothetical protein